MGTSPASETIDVPEVDPDIIRSVIDEIPLQKSYVLSQRSGSLQMTVMPRAWKDAGRSLEDPGSAKQYYFEDQEILVVDLSQP